ncbi:MAG: diguanylate cyclase [Thermodesulfobacteriota bacterium]
MNPSTLREIQRNVEALEKEIHLLRSALETFPEPFFILDRKGGFLKTNPEGRAILNYPWEQFHRMNLIDVISLEDLIPMREELERMEEGKPFCLKIHLVNRLGEKIFVESIGMIKGDFIFLTLRDLRERIEVEQRWEKTKKELTEKIQERDQYARELQALKDLYKERVKEIEKMREEALLLSYTDDLTGIYNHRFFIQQLTLEVERQKRYSQPLSLLMIDIDHFKYYNDSNGHLAGDQVLKAIAILIQHGVRQTDIVARYGGEEFTAILTNARKEMAFEIAERIRRSIAETHFPNEKAQPGGDLTVSIGVATFSPPLSTLTDLIREADRALYQAKKRGRNRVEG